MSVAACDGVHSCLCSDLFNNWSQRFSILADIFAPVMPLPCRRAYTRTHGYYAHVYGCAAGATTAFSFTLRRQAGSSLSPFTCRHKGTQPSHLPHLDREWDYLASHWQFAPSEPPTRLYAHTPIPPFPSPRCPPAPTPTATLFLLLHPRGRRQACRLLGDDVAGRWTSSQAVRHHGTLLAGLRIAMLTDMYSLPFTHATPVLPLIPPGGTRV